MINSSTIALAAAAFAVALEPSSRRSPMRLAELCAVPAASSTASEPASSRVRTPLRMLLGCAVGAVLGALTGSTEVGVLSMACGAALALCTDRLLAVIAAIRARLGHRGDATDPRLAAQLAATWDLLVACLMAGLAVPTAIRAVSPAAPRPIRALLLRTAELLALGADHSEAWSPLLEHPATAGLGRSARRTARSGAVLAETATELAGAVRAGANDAAEAAAARASVLVTIPLGLCFLPAFLCLGVIPVVVGLAGSLLHSW